LLTLDGDRFTCGRATFSDSSPYQPEPTAKVYVKVRFGNLHESVMAQIDTGAAWSILAPDMAQAVNVSFENGDSARLNTRLGIKRGRLVKVGFTFVAEAGDPFDTEGTFFVSPDWPDGLNFLGYSGCLDSIRFALDPQANYFYFGPGL
jgi:hypothetical protein